MSFSPPTGSGGTRSRLRAGAEWIDQRDWSGVAGATDWILCQAIMLVMVRAWRTEVGMSVRELAELSGIPRQTVAKSLHRLRQKGFIKRTSKAKGALPARYVLHLDGYVAAAGYHSSSESVHVLRHGGSDVFCRYGIGPNPLRVWHLVIISGPMRVSAISLRLGLHRSTVYRCL